MIAASSARRSHHGVVACQPVTVPDRRDATESAAWWIGADTNHVDSFRKRLSTFSRLAQDAVYPHGWGGPNASKGEGPDFVRSHSLTNDGSFPHDTSGGQLPVGQAAAGHPWTFHE